MTSAIEKCVARKDGAPPQFSLLLAKLAILAAGNQNYAMDHESLVATDGEIFPVVDAAQLVVLRAEMTGPCFSSFLHCYLLDVEFHLEDIARARRSNDFPRLARKADILAGTAADVGALRTSAAARRLGAASRAGDALQTCRLAGELSARCTESEMDLRRFLAYRARAAGAA